MRNNFGRPSKYEPDCVNKVEEYLDTTGKEQTSLPTMQGLALALNVNGDTLVEWGKKYSDFSAALERLKLKQACTQ